MALLRVDNLVVGIGGLTPVDGVSFSIEAGETFVLLGESGCGKSMTSLALMRLLPDGMHFRGGQVTFDGIVIRELPESRMRSMRGSGMAMIFQEPQTSLNPVMTIGEQIAEALPSGLADSEKARETIRLLEEVGIPDPAQRIHAYPFELSGGQKQRVMIAQALAGNPKLLIADEPTTALDVSLQAQILQLLKRLTHERGMAMLLITHDLGVARTMANRIGVMYAGQLVEVFPVDQEAKACHPYTQKLLEAVPSIERAGSRLAAIPGRVPPLGQRFTGCRFAERCQQVFTPCTQFPPDWNDLDQGHRVRCFLAGQAQGSKAISAGPVANTDRERKTVTEGAQAILSVRGLKVAYTQRTGQWLGKKVIHAVDGIDFDLAKGETLALVGESGCGKTTAAKAILGLTPPSAGEIWLKGANIAGLPEKAFRPHRRFVQIVFQDPYSSLNPRMRIGEILAEGLKSLDVTSQDDRKTMLADILEQVGLNADAIAKYPHEFSGGQRQRIAIARALAVKPEVLICDEPTSALDVSVQAQILNLLSDLQAETGLAMLFITHNLAAVGYLAHRVAVMQKGKIVETGRTDDVLTQPEHPYTQSLLAAVV